MAMIPEDKINEIRNGVNLVHYISQFVQLKKAGQNFKGLCPFHTEKTPSFVVSPAKQIYHCFGCGKGGNVLTFIKEYEKLPFLEAVKKAANFAGISLPKMEQDPAASWTYLPLVSVPGVPVQKHVYVDGASPTNPIFALTTAAKDPAKILAWYDDNVTSIDGLLYKMLGIPEKDWT